MITLLIMMLPRYFLYVKIKMLMFVKNIKNTVKNYGS